MRLTVSFRKYVLPMTVVCLTFLSTQVIAALPIKEIPLKSGAKLYFIETRAIPMVDIGIDFTAGDYYDPTGKAGVSDLTASMMNKGSKIAGKIQGEAFIADTVSDKGAVLSFNASSENSSLRIRSLSRSDVLNPLIAEVADIAAYPIFDAAILDREKAREISALKESESKPEYMLSKQFQSMVYRQYPLGIAATKESITAIKADDLKKFHARYYQAASANVLIVGDLDQARAIEIAERLTANLPKGEPLPKPMLPLDALPKRPADQREIRLSNPSQQAHIRMGMTGVARSDPDYFPLLVGNYILGGGGFVSRLMNEVREKRGLAYSVSSYFYPGKTTGIFVAGLQTKKDQADQALSVMRTTIEQFVKNGPTEQELKAAKDNLINGFPLRIDSNRKLLDNLSSIAWNGLPLDTLDVWTQNVNKVTREDIEKAFQKHLDVERMVTVVVGAQ
jgi:zinc protease